MAKGGRRGSQGGSRRGRRALLHIGLEKTGSTSIQFALARSRERLAAAGRLYPRSAGRFSHVKLYCYASQGPLDEIKGQLGLRGPEETAAFRAGLEQALLQEVERSGAGELLLSNEHCSSRLLQAEELERLRALLGRLADEVRVLLYIRPQWDLLASHYSTYVKTGGTRPLDFPGEKALAGQYDFRAVIERWQAVFGAEAVSVRRYAAEGAPGGDTLDDFAAVAGLEGLLERSEKRNVALSAEAVAFLRRFNHAVPRTLDFRYNELRGNIEGLLEGCEGGSEFRAPPALIARMRDWARPGNDWVAERFFGGGPLFEEPAPAEAAEAAVPEPELDLEEAFRLFAHAWAEKQRQVNRLRARLEAGEAAPDAAAPPRRPLRALLRRLRRRPGP